MIGIYLFVMISAYTTSQAEPVVRRLQKKVDSSTTEPLEDEAGVVPRPPALAASFDEATASEFNVSTTSSELDSEDSLSDAALSDRVLNVLKFAKVGCKKVPGGILKPDPKNCDTKLCDGVIWQPITIDGFKKNGATHFGWNPKGATGHGAFMYWKPPSTITMCSFGETIDKPVDKDDEALQKLLNGANPKLACKRAKEEDAYSKDGLIAFFQPITFDALKIGGLTHFGWVREGANKDGGFMYYAPERRVRGKRRRSRYILCSF